jgi:transposase
MSESRGIDSIFGGRSMPKPCSLDLRIRLLDAVIAGASRREAADCFDVSASSAVKWLQCWEETGSIAARPTGGSISPLEEHADWLLALISQHSDLTLDEIVAAMRKRRIAGSRSAVWRFFRRHNISFKKNSVRGGAEARGRGPRPAALDARTGHV